MQSAEDYLRKTESAVRLLFTGIDSYLQVLRQATGVVFVTGEPDESKREAAFSAWLIQNAQRLDAARAAEREFLAESFALDTLCGAILQVAGKALELYGTNSVIPTGLPTAIKLRHAKFCVGRLIRTVPLGLVIYAARNQHTHFNDDQLNEPSSSVFNLLATANGYGGGQHTRPATPATTPASAMLVEIRLTKPAGAIAGGLLTLTQQEDGLITSTGVATWARLVNGNEVTALDLDCSGTDGDGDVKLAATQLYLGGDARMVSAILG